MEYVVQDLSIQVGLSLTLGPERGPALPLTPLGSLVTWQCCATGKRRVHDSQEPPALGGLCRAPPAWGGWEGAGPSPGVQRTRGQQGRAAPPAQCFCTVGFCPRGSLYRPGLTPALLCLDSGDTIRTLCICSHPLGWDTSIVSGLGLSPSRLAEAQRGIQELRWVQAAWPLLELNSTFHLACALTSQFLFVLCWKSLKRNAARSNTSSFLPGRTSKHLSQPSPCCTWCPRWRRPCRLQPAQGPSWCTAGKSLHLT